VGFPICFRAKLCFGRMKKEHYIHHEKCSLKFNSDGDDTMIILRTGGLSPGPRMMTVAFRYPCRVKNVENITIIIGY